MNRLSIIEIELRCFHRALKGRPAANSHRRWTHRSGVLLRLIDEQGRSGVGEASPLPGYSTDAASQAYEELRMLRPIPLSSEWEQACEGMTQNRNLGPSACFAVETALADLLAQQQQCSLAEILCKHPAQRVDATHLLDSSAIVSDALHAADRGFSCFKMKIGADPDQTLKHVEAIRQELPDARLRLDANGSLSISDYLRLSEHLSPYAIEFLEQPVSPSLLPGLTCGSLPLAVDESLHVGCSSPLPPVEMIRILKPTAIGGLRRALFLARESVAVVSHTLEGPVATAACCELALALHADNRLAAGLESHAGLSAFPELLVPHFDGARIDRAPNNGQILGHGVRWESLEP